MLPLRSDSLRFASKLLNAVSLSSILCLLGSFAVAPAMAETPNADFTERALSATLPGAVIDPGASLRQDDAMQRLGLRSCRVVPVLVSFAPTGLDLGQNAQAPSGTLALELTPGSFSTFVLEPYSLRSADFQLVAHGDAGPVVVPAPAPTTYRGRNELGDEVWASIYRGEVNAVVVRASAPLNRLFIQPMPLPPVDPAQSAPLATNPAADTGAMHVVYAASDVLPTEHTCGVDQCGPCQAGAGRMSSVPSRFVPRGVIPCRFIRLNVDADFPLYQQSARDLGAVVRSIESVMIGVNQVYLNAAFSTDIRFTITRLTIRTSATEPYAAIPAIGGDIGALLTQVANTWPPAIATRDLTHLFSGRDGAGSTIGLAYVGVTCDSFNSGVSETNFSATLARRQQLTAHEIGHNFGMQHDASGASFIMAPSVSDPAQTAFSVASATSINAHMASRATCGVATVTDVQPDAASTTLNRAVRIDVLANDGRIGAACPTAVTSFTLPSTSTGLGGTVSVSVGTGPGGRNQVLYTPPTGVQGATDTFNYVASSVTSPVTVEIQIPRAADGAAGVNAGLNATYWDTRPSGAGSFWVWDLIPLDYKINPQTGAMAPVFATTTLPQINYSGLLPGGFQRGMSAEITGFVRVPSAGYWTFALAARTSARLYIGNEQLVAAPAAAAGAAVSGTRALAAGLHAIRVDYDYGPGSASLVLSYAPEGSASTVIPATEFFRNLAPPCRADFNGVGGVTVPDIFDFLAAWFANDPRADFDGVGGVAVPDIFAFLAAWFAGC